MNSSPNGSAVSVLLLAAVAWGCAEWRGTAGERRADREAYIAAMAAAPDEGQALCRGIVQPLLRDECIAYAAGRLSAVGATTEAQAICETIESPAWHDECWFITIEKAEHAGPELVASCANARAFESSCVDHLFHRHVELGSDLPSTIGDEVALIKAVRGLVGEYYSGQSGPFKRERLRRGVGKRIAKRWEEVPFDLELCGEAQPTMCARAYQEGLREPSRAVELDELCAMPITGDRVRAIGMHGWTPQSDEVALGVWLKICESHRTFGLFPR